MSDQTLDENKIRQRIQSAFEEMNETKPNAAEIAFHLTDWLADLKEIQDVYSNIENVTNDELTVFFYKFLSHVPNHLNAAVKLSGLGKVKDIFEVGIFEDDD
jgi:hypothetical protein